MSAQYTPYEVAQALGMYAYNESALDWVADVFPGRHPDYIAEKGRLAARGFWTFYGALDGTNRRRIVDIALDRYGAQARAEASYA